MARIRGLNITWRQVLSGLLYEAVSLGAVFLFLLGLGYAFLWVEEYVWSKGGHLL